jgi:hypothetical protein
MLKNEGSSVVPGMQHVKEKQAIHAQLVGKHY